MAGASIRDHIHLHVVLAGTVTRTPCGCLARCRRVMPELIRTAATASDPCLTQNREHDAPGLLVASLDSGWRF